VTSSVNEVECVTVAAARRSVSGLQTELHGSVTFFDEAVHRVVLRELRPRPCSPLRIVEMLLRGALIDGFDRARVRGSRRAVSRNVEKQAVLLDGAGCRGRRGNFLRGRGGLRAKFSAMAFCGMDCGTGAALLLAADVRGGWGGIRLAWSGGGGRWVNHQAARWQHGAWPLLFSCRADQAWSPADLRGSKIVTMMEEC